MNKYIEKIEETLAKWLKPLPHLPVKFTKWVATNLWWIVLIGVVLSALSLIAMFTALFAIFAYLNLGTTTVLGHYVTSSYSVFSALASIVSILFMIGTIVLTAMSISPLKSSLRKGWTLLFMVMLIQATFVVISAVLSGNVFLFVSNLLSGAVGVAISAYLLFELRSYFVGKAVKATVVSAKK